MRAARASSSPTRSRSRTKSGASSETVSSAAAADLEAVLLDLMDRDAPGDEDAGSTTRHDDAPSAGAAR